MNSSIPNENGRRRRRRPTSSSDVIAFPAMVALSFVFSYIVFALIVMDSKARDKLLDLSAGKKILITGASAGIGLAAVDNLYGHHNGPDLVIMGCRSMDKCEKARMDIITKYSKDKAKCNRNSEEKVCRAFPTELICLELDLARNQSVRKFAKEVNGVLKRWNGGRKKKTSLDILINNAGVAGPPTESVREAAELTMQINHYGHFLLTSLMMPSLLASEKGGRVVNVSSLAGYLWMPQFLYKILPSGLSNPNNYDPADPQFEKVLCAYEQSKRANLLFTNALQERFGGIHNFTAVASHPGYSRTSLPLTGFRFAPENFRKFFAYNPVMSMSSDAGSLTTLKAALDLGKVSGGKFVGPIFGAIGRPVVIGTSLNPFLAFDKVTAGDGKQSVDILWDHSEQVVGEKFFRAK